MPQTANYRRLSTYESAQSAKPAQSALFAAKLLPNLPKRANGLIVWDQPFSFLRGSGSERFTLEKSRHCVADWDGWVTEDFAPDREGSDVVEETVSHGHIR